MALAPFFERVYGAIGGHLAVSRESLSASLGSVTAGVHCGANCGRNEIWIAELATNLLARLYPRVAICGPESLTSALKQLAESINPRIDFEKDSPGTTSICVGAVSLSKAIFPSSSGWVARVSHSGPQLSGPENPYAAGAAASLACAELFRRVLLNADTERDVSLSLLDFGKKTGANLELKAISLGEVAFAGVGAIGNAAIWALSRHRRLRGHVWLVDAEDLTLLNLQRYVLGTDADVARPKVQLAKQALLKTDLIVEAWQTSFENFEDAGEVRNIPTVCISVDNIETRRAAQALLPKLIVNGWTGDRALGASWHVLSRDAACLACLYQPHGQGPSATEQAARALGLPVERATLLWVTQGSVSDDDLTVIAQHLGLDKSTLESWRGRSLGDLYTDVVCGAVPLDLVGVGRLETVPLAHQSSLAGILMAAELVKRTQPRLAARSQKQPLVAWDDVLRAPPTLWSKPRPREPGCICTDTDYQEEYRHKWGPAHKRSAPSTRR